MNETPKPWVWRSPIIDELHFDSFHWSNGKDGLTHPSTKTTQHSVDRTEVAFVIHRHLLQLLK